MKKATKFLLIALIAALLLGTLVGCGKEVVYDYDYLAEDLSRCP